MPDSGLFAELPPDRRKPMSERLPEVLAASKPCKKTCKFCSSMSPKTADAALFIWDDLARSGMWPIPAKTVRAILHGAGIHISAIKLAGVIGHRRYHVMQRIIRKEIQELAEVNAAPTVAA